MLQSQAGVAATGVVIVSQDGQGSHSQRGGNGQGGGIGHFSILNEL